MFSRIIISYNNKTWLLSRDLTFLWILKLSKLQLILTSWPLCHCPMPFSFFSFPFFVAFSRHSCSIRSRKHNFNLTKSCDDYPALFLHSTCINNLYVNCVFYFMPRPRKRITRKNHSFFTVLWCYDTFGKYRALWTLPTNNVNIVRVHFKCEHDREVSLNWPW